MLGSAIYITDLVGIDDAPEQFEDPEAIRLWFGSTLRSMNTLFIFLTFDDWSTAARMVNKVHPWMEIFWMAYILFGAFTLLSVLTGLMADCMNAARQEELDEELDEEE